MTNHAVAAALSEIGTLLELKGENDFRTKAYHAAARAVSDVEGDVAALVAEGRVGEVRGVGAAIAEKIAVLVTTGRLPYLDELRASLPAGLVQMLRVPGLGPKKAKAVYDALRVDSIAALREACERGEVAKVKGFGEKTQQRVLDAVRFLEAAGGRARINRADRLAAAVWDAARQLPGVTRAEVVGGLRRRQETVARVEVLAAAADPAPAVDAFVGLPMVAEVVARETAAATVVADLALDTRKITLPVALRVVPAEAFPAAAVVLTGSPGHVDKLRLRAADRGLDLTEAGLTGAGGPVPCPDEAAVYRALGLLHIPPELREDTGEIDAAEAGGLPALVDPAAVRGVFHNHTTASDGTASLEEMALAAKALGYEYFGVADHSQSLTVAGGLSPARVRQQWAEADALNRKLTGVRVLKGTECDILPDGALDYPDDLLAGFDYVVASVHSHFHLTEEDQTARVCKALAHPAVTWLGHPTGRLLLRRDGYKLDLGRVLRAAADHGKMVEINAQPDRLDLDWRWVKRAKDLGVPLVISPDAHDTGALGLIPYGVDVARRGWLTAAEVFNTRPLIEAAAELERRRARWVR